MKKLTFTQKQEVLTNALRFFNIPKKYFIEPSDTRCGQRFAIVSKCKDSTGIQTHSNYMTYEEMNAYLMGYNQGITNILK